MTTLGHYAKCRVLFIDECHYAESRYAECHGALKIYILTFINGVIFSTEHKSVKANFTTNISLLDR